MWDMSEVDILKINLMSIWTLKILLVSGEAASAEFDGKGGPMAICPALSVDF